MGRHNYVKHREEHRDWSEQYDHEYVLRPDRPDVRYFVRHSRKLIEVNVDASPGAWRVVETE